MFAGVFVGLFVHLTTKHANCRYNLGWLPGGDKSITTNLEDTIASIDSAKRLIKSGGMISVMLYAGHTEVGCVLAGSKVLFFDVALVGAVVGFGAMLSPTFTQSVDYGIYEDVVTSLSMVTGIRVAKLWSWSFGRKRSGQAGV